MPAKKPGVSPPPSSASVTVSKSQLSVTRARQCDVVIALVPGQSKAAHFAELGQSTAVHKRWRRVEKHAGSTFETSLVANGSTRLCVGSFNPQASRFEQMNALRPLIVRALNEQPGSIGITCAGFSDSDGESALALLVEGLLIASYRLPNFSNAPVGPALSQVTVFAPGIRRTVDLAIARAEANNRVRWLGALPPNILSASGLRRHAQTLAKKIGCTHEFLGETALAKLGAGAFLAVSQGNAERDAGIVRLSYKPRARKRVALVGKGIIFDTGGSNLKPFKGMLDMHLDMLGSAVALSTFEALVAARVDYGVDCWLAVTENRISAKSYKSRDVITAANGKTIEAIHTDAEGRMALADTLVLAAKKNPVLIVDFATLTGACVTAVTDRQSGVFTNRATCHAQLIRVGSSSGERVWPFPIDEEFDEALNSKVADLIQCSPDGSGDHILAARFLSHFVPDTIPWIHVDLSSAMRSGGLGLAPTQVTGFGPRFTLSLLDELDELLEVAEQ